MPGAVWPLLGRHFGLAPSGLGVWLGAACAGYLTSSIASGPLTQRFGAGRVLAISVAATAAAALGQATAPPWAGFLGLALLSGLGGGAVDSAMNTVVARRFGARQVNWLHACWGLGATAGPLLLGVLLGAGAGWPAGFLAVGIGLAGLGTVFLLTGRRWDDAATIGDAAPDAAVPTPSLPSPSLRQAWRLPAARSGMLVFWLYTGTEAMAGQWAASVLVARGWTAPAAGLATALFWGALTAGRVLLGLIVDRVGPARLLRVSVLVAAIAALLFASGLGASDIPALAVLGFALAPLYPTLMSLTPARAGAAAPHAIGLQVAAAMLGGLSLPAIAGVGADHLGFGVVPLLLVGSTVALAALILDQSRHAAR